MKYEFFIGFRYLRARRKRAFVSIIGFISILGVFIGVMALDVVLAVMKGFEDELREKIVGVNSHLVVLNYEGGVADYEELQEEVLKFPGVKGASPFIYGQAMLVSETGVMGVVIRGIKPETAGDVTTIEDALGRGALGRGEKVEEEKLKTLGKELIMKLDGAAPSGKPPILIGRELAVTLGVFSSDLVSVVSPLGKIGPLGPQAKIKRFEVVGIFDYGMVEYDSSLAYVSLKDAMDFFEMGGKVTGVEMRLKDIYSAKNIGDRITETLGFPFYTRNWQEVNRSLFKALRMERIAIAIFLGLIILVAVLDIVSTLTMVVMEKGKDIAILRAMGATSGGIMRIFITEGMVIGIVGTLLGTAAGYGICYLIKTSDLVKGLLPFDPEVYPVSEFPVKIEAIYFIGVALISLLICFLGTLYPSYQASKKDPVEALRYE